MILFRIIAVAASILAAACGGKTQEPNVPAAEQAPLRVSSASPPRKQMSMSSELGEIDARAVDKAFQKLQSSFAECHQKGLEKLDYMSGDLKFFFRVTQEGAVRWVYLEESTLGDRDTERCMIDVVSHASWPLPRGGEAEVHRSIAFDAPGDVRAPSKWTGEKLSAIQGKSREALAKCKATGQGSFRITAYVETAGGDGKIQAVGVAPPSNEAEKEVDCIVNAIKELRVPSPGSYAAKVTFVL